MATHAEASANTLPFADRPVERAPGHWVLARAGKKVLRPGGLALSTWALKRAGIPGAHVVEFAPGLGVTAGAIIGVGPASYVGVERDPDACARVNAIASGVGRCVNADAAETGLADQSADVVVGEAMLSMQGEKTKRAIVGEAARILRPGGRYVIHELAMTVISEAGMPVYDAEEVRRRWLSLLDDTAATGRTPPALLGRWEQALEDTALWRFRPTVVHGDLAEENVLVAGGTVVAVRGWSQAHVGDPAEDLAWVYSSAPVDCLDSIEDAYDIARSEGVDRHLRERAELVSELSLARWLLHGVRTGDKPVINDAVAMLEDLAAQVGDAPLVEPATPRLAPVPGVREPAEPDAITNPVAMVRVDDEES